MDDILREIFILTEQMSNHLDQADAQELAQFVNRRQELMDQIEANFWAVQMISKEKADQILQFDRLITAKIEQKRNEAERELAKVRIASKQKMAYENSATSDSYFFDRRK